MITYKKLETNISLSFEDNNNGDGHTFTKYFSVNALMQSREDVQYLMNLLDKLYGFLPTRDELYPKADSLTAHLDSNRK